MSTEIERKFIVHDLPPAGLGSRIGIRQGYVAEEGETEVRVRITADASVITIKIGGAHATKRGRGTRTEVEVAVGRDDAEELWAHTEGRRIVKTRSRVDVDGGVAEIDVYEGVLRGLIVVEVEFESEHASAAFAPPGWFGPEVTGRVEWSNASLARNGRPVEPPAVSTDAV